MMYFRRTLKPRAAKPISIYRFGQLRLDPKKESAMLDGEPHAAKLGCWMFYLPGLQAKLFHARHGCIDCTHRSRPPDEILMQPGVELGRYVSDDWRTALTTPITRRLAELWIISIRLWRGGLGPQPLGPLQTHFRRSLSFCAGSSPVDCDFLDFAA